MSNYKDNIEKFEKINRAYEIQRDKVLKLMEERARKYTFKLVAEILGVSQQYVGSVFTKGVPVSFKKIMEIKEALDKIAKNFGDD